MDLGRGHVYGGMNIVNITEYEQIYRAKGECGGWLSLWRWLEWALDLLAFGF